MPYNFLDPYQRDEFRAKAEEAYKAAGKSVNSKAIEDHIYDQATRQSKYASLELGQLETAQKTLDILSPGSEPLSEKTEFEKKMVNAKMASDRALQLLETSGEVAGPITTRASKIGEFFGKPGEGTEYRAALGLASAQLFNALAGTTQSPQELINLQKLIPKDTDQEATAKKKLETLLSMLERQMTAYGIDTSKISGRDGLDTGAVRTQTAIETQQTSPAFNITGQVAKKGDLVLDPLTGDLERYGEEIRTEPGRFKNTKSGGEVENGLIKWLADSEFLPIAGSVIGALMGAGAGSIATGAVGAAGGKAIQLALREMIDPERQDFGDAATAVLLEGVSDAIIGGTMFKIGKYGSKGLKLILGETAEATGKAAGKELIEEGIEAGIKKGARQEVAEGLVKQGLGVTPSKIKRASSAYKGDILEAVAKKGYRSTKEAAELSGKELRAASKTLDKLLKKSGNAKTDEVITLLENSKTAFKSPAGEIIPTAATGVGKIDEWINYVKSFGDEIPMKELNKVKKGLQEVFPKTATEITSSSKKVVADASKMVREYIEKEGVEGIADTNKEIILTKFVNDAAVDKITTSRFKLISNLTDLAMGVSNPAFWGGKKALELFASQFDDLAKAKLLMSSIQVAQARGDKLAIRNILRFAEKLGVNFGVSKELLGKSFRGVVAGAGASAVTSGLDTGAVEEPGMDTMKATPEEIQQPGFMYR